MDDAVARLELTSTSLVHALEGSPGILFQQGRQEIEAGIADVEMERRPAMAPDAP